MEKKQEKDADVVQKRRMKRLFSPERTDAMLEIAPYRGVIVLATVILLILILIIWSFIGRIPTEITGRGVALTGKGFFNVTAQSSGTIKGVSIKEGESVKTDQLLLKMETPDVRSILKKISTSKFKIENLNTQQYLLKDRAKLRATLLKSGLIPKSNLEDDELAISQKQISIEEENASIIGYISDLEKASTVAITDTMRQHLIEQPAGQMDLERWNRDLSLVQSPYDGNVLEIFVRQGDVVSGKEPLIWMEFTHDPNEPIMFFCCIPADAGDIRPGMQVKIDPSIVNPQEYGLMLGIVKEVSPFVISEEGLYSALYNKQLANYLASVSSAVIKVIVEPILDKSTVSGYAWTSTKGPPFRIKPGSLANIKILVDEQPPISFLIPIWKLKTAY